MSGRDGDNDIEDDNSDNEEPTEILTKLDFKDAMIMNAISILEDYNLFTKFRVDLRKALSDLGRVLDADNSSNKKQSKIKHFFSYA